MFIDIQSTQTLLCQPASEFLPMIEEVSHITEEMCVRDCVCVSETDSSICRLPKILVAKSRSANRGVTIYLYIYICLLDKVDLSIYTIKFQVYKELLEKTQSIPGANVENNKFCVSVHFRCVDEKVCILYIHDSDKHFTIINDYLVYSSAIGFFFNLHFMMGPTNKFQNNLCFR